MRHVIRLTGTISVALLTLAAGTAPARDFVAGTLHDASAVLEGLPGQPTLCIPPALLRDAKAVAINPHVIKIGFGVAGRHGDGVVLARTPDGCWGKPVFISLTGGSIGWQVGVESVDIVLVFKTEASVERLLRGKGKLTLGADVAVATGPVGRQAEADTDARLRAEIYSYSRSRGLFLGLSLEGAAILNHLRANEQFLQHPSPGDVAAAERLRAQLTALSKPPVVLGPLPPTTVPVIPHP
jgi:lipid-binding SYLF domain-containing protein